MIEARIMPEKRDERAWLLKWHVNFPEAKCAGMSTGLNISAQGATTATEGGMASVVVPEPAPSPICRPIRFFYPRSILFGDGCSNGLGETLVAKGLKSAFVVSDSNVASRAGRFLEGLGAAGLEVTVCDRVDREPTVAMFEECLAQARRTQPDVVVGLGGGSALDVAKLVAALAGSGQSLPGVFGIDQLEGRALFMVCVPTTAGTGSEVSPNAILLDEESREKRGVISPYLVPDIACVDPMLTWSLPPALTAATGIDALTHCIEAVGNKFSHPIADAHALEGIRLIASGLLEAVVSGTNADARAKMALGSMYGGFCLGPVNTAAVHALAYPLGSLYHVGHGLSNAVLLPHVMRFNLPFAAESYERVALAMGIPRGNSSEQTAMEGIRFIEGLIRECPIAASVSQLGVPRAALPTLATAAMKVTRLLKNNPRPVSEAEALEIYNAAW